VKLLIVVGDFPPFVSGIGDYTDLLARSLSSIGVEVTVLTLEGNDDGVSRPYKVRREMPAFTMKEMNWATQIASGFDVVNIQYPGVHYGRSPMMNLFSAYLRRRAPQVKTTVTIHDCRVMRWRWRLRTWPMLNTVAGIIHVDPGDWPYINSWCTFGAPPRACIPIASNVEVLPCSAESRAAWRAGLGIAESETAIAYFGILYPHKGVDELLTAHASLRRKGHLLRTVIIGPFDREEPWCEPLRERFKEEGVIWVPDASLTRVSECLHACDLAALPFHSGTSTNRSSMLAALGHGLPTVTTDGPATPKEIGELFDLVLVPPTDAAGLERGIESVLKDASLRERLRASALVTRSRTTWQGAAHQHVAFFEELLGRPQAREATCGS
jgi:glycosyltransferase involved in cell wall biosynthesis